MSSFPHLAQHLFNVPLAISKDKAEVIMAALADRLGVTRLFLPDGRIRAFDGDSMAVVDVSSLDESKGYEVIAGVAVIEIHGTLVQRQMGLRPISGMTGYNALRQNFFTALADPEVKAIAFDIDSPGGESAGLFDLTDDIFAARGKKPIWSILNERAASAGYALAAAADRVTVPRTGYAGSIGVIWLHCDLSRMLDKQGVTVTILQYGARKADGANVMPLSDAARESIQADIDAVGDLFVASVARYRKVPATRIRDQEAAVFLGAHSVTAGLVDEVMSPAAAFAQLAARVN